MKVWLPVALVSLEEAAAILQPNRKIKWFGDTEFTQERRGGEESVLAQCVTFVLGEQVPGLGRAGRYRLTQKRLKQMVLETWFGAEPAARLQCTREILEMVGRDVWLQQKAESSFKVLRKDEKAH